MGRIHWHCQKGGSEKKICRVKCDQRMIKKDFKKELTMKDHLQ